MRVLQRYQIPLTIRTFVNCYRCLSLLKLSNQVLWLNDRTTTLVLAVELLDLCCDAGLLILNRRTPSDESKEFICLVNGGCNTVNYIVGSLAV
jgi:hypothetical protein